jgi:hypothetical protein
MTTAVALPEPKTPGAAFAGTTTTAFAEAAVWVGATERGVVWDGAGVDAADGTATDAAFAITCTAVPDAITAFAGAGSGTTATFAATTATAFAGAG